MVQAKFGQLVAEVEGSFFLTFIMQFSMNWAEHICACYRRVETLYQIWREVDNLVIKTYIRPSYRVLKVGLKRKGYTGFDGDL